MDLLDKYHFYINRSDRGFKSKECSDALKSFGISQPIRLDAVKHEIGYVGCAQSHIKCIELAKERDYPFVCIFEDDIIFRNIDKCKEMIDKYINYEYDVLYLGCNITNNNYTFVTDDLIQVNNALCNHAYIVKSHYYDKLLLNYREGVNLKLKNPKDKRYNLDEYLSILQMEDKWYSFYPHFVSQKAGHSDTINEKVDLCEEIFDIPIHNSKLPHVSLLTPTFNRRIFLELMISNIQNFSYPKEKIEWNILESNDKKIENYQRLFDSEPTKLENFLGIKINYVYTDKSLSIGEKRNMLCESSSHDYLINMDDDDIYLPEYINHSIGILINQNKDITSCLDMLFIYPQKNFKTSYIRCVRDYKLYHEAPLCMKKSHWEKYKYTSSNKGEGITVYGNKDVCGISSVLKCMICVCWAENTVNKDMFLQYPVDMRISGEGMGILKNIFSEYKKVESEKTQEKDIKDINEIKEVKESGEDKVMISKSLLKEIRNLIENTTSRIHWTVDELLPVGLIVKKIDVLLTD